MTSHASKTTVKAETIAGTGRTDAIRRQVARTRRRFDRATHRLDRLLRRGSLPLLRFSLGVVFVWFGGLKVAGATPVTELVGQTVPWVDPDWFVPFLGVVEVALGLALMLGYRLGWVCAVMVGHLAGTFLTVVMQPELMFSEGNPLMLTMEGEFVAKNLVLITAALVIAAWSRQPRSAPAVEPAVQVRAAEEAPAAVAAGD